MEISPDAALWELLFQALVDSKNKYVVESHAVSYAPSLSVLVEIKLKQKKQTTDSTLLTFGNPSHNAIPVSGEKNARPVLMGIELMLGFYRQFQNNSRHVSKAEDLRQSSLALLRNDKYAHPFYWAGFVIIGDGK